MSTQVGERGKKTLEQLLDEVEAQTAEATPSAEPERSGQEGETISPAAMLQLAGKLPALMSVLGGPPKGGGKEKQDPQALLCALRPYLNSRRREAIDSMLQLWKIRALLQTLRQE